MGGCFSKFGTYFIRKEEGNSGTKGDGTTPKLKQVAKKESFATGVEKRENGDVKEVINGSTKAKNSSSVSSSSDEENIKTSSEAMAPEKVVESMKKNEQPNVMATSAHFIPSDGPQTQTEEVILTASSVIIEPERSKIVEETSKNTVITTTITTTAVMTEEIMAGEVTEVKHTGYEATENYTQSVGESDKICLSEKNVEKTGKDGDSIISHSSDDQEKETEGRDKIMDIVESVKSIEVFEVENRPHSHAKVEQDESKSDSSNTEIDNVEDENQEARKRNASLIQAEVKVKETLEVVEDKSSDSSSSEDDEEEDNKSADETVVELSEKRIVINNSYEVNEDVEITNRHSTSSPEDVEVKPEQSEVEIEGAVSEKKIEGTIEDDSDETSDDEGHKVEEPSAPPQVEDEVEEERSAAGTCYARLVTPSGFSPQSVGSSTGLAIAEPDEENYHIEENAEPDEDNDNVSENSDARELRDDSSSSSSSSDNNQDEHDVKDIGE